jgi:hypothetical protein
LDQLILRIQGLHEKGMKVETINLQIRTESIKDLKLIISFIVYLIVDCVDVCVLYLPELQGQLLIFDLMVL